VVQSFFEEVFSDSIRCHTEFITAHVSALEEVAQQITSCFQAGGKLLLFGNGGSAADAQHLAAEFVNRLVLNRPALPAIALTTDSSIITSISNDFDYNSIFARQIEALGKPGDIAWGMSTSGNSQNVIAGIKMATTRKMITIASLGNKGGKIAGIVDFPLIVPSISAQRIQEVHITMGHALCHWVEQTLFGDSD